MTMTAGTGSAGYASSMAAKTENKHNHRGLIVGVRSRLPGQRGQFPAKFERETAFYDPGIIHNPTGIGA
jgi:hypothetical protein